MAAIRKISIVTLALVSVGILSCQRLDKQPTFVPSVFSSHRYVAHAMGAVDNHTYTNSREAFLENYARGRRVFEVDLSITGDGRVVSFHNNAERMFGLKRLISETSHSEFMQSRIAGRFTPLDMEGLIRLMEDYPDMYLVTDIKGGSQVIRYVLDRIVKEALVRDSSVVERIVPQVYDLPTYADAMAVHPFREIIYTLYLTNASDDEVIAFLEANKNITALTVSKRRFNASLARRVRALGRFLFVHTVNEPDEIRKFSGRGAYGFYTDGYFPEAKP